MGESLLMPFYTSFNTDISGTRKDIKKRLVVFLLAVFVLSHKKMKLIISYPL